MDGFIKLHRKLIEWEWYSDINVTRVFIHCLLEANHKDNKWRGQVIKRGSFITSYEKLAIATTLTVQQVRTALNKLKSTSEITYKSTSYNSIITINNWDKYQLDNKQNNKQITNEQQTNNKQITTNKNDKNVKNDKNTYKDSYIYDTKKEKKLEPFFNPIKTFFINEYKRVFNTRPYLNAQDCVRLTELASDNEDIREIIPQALERLKAIDFEGINFTPSASWLLKDNNFERVMNGEFQKRTETKGKSTAQILEEIRQKRLAEGKGDF